MSYPNHPRYDYSGDIPMNEVYTDSNVSFDARAQLPIPTPGPPPRIVARIVPRPPNRLYSHVAKLVCPFSRPPAC